MEVVEEDGKQAVARLILGEGSAVLHYHAASRDTDFGAQLLANRLAQVETGPRELRLALVLAPEAPRTTGGAALHDLEVESAARLVALAQALGAWDLLRRGRFPRRPDGRPFLPFFVPREPGDWQQLRGNSLVGFLPEPLALYLAETPGLRQASYGHLSTFARRIPALEAALAELADAPRALLREVGVAHTQRFVDDQYVRIDAGRDRESEPNIHARGIMLERLIDPFGQTGKLNNRIEPLFHLPARQSHDRAVKKHVFPAAQVRMESGTQFKQ